MVEGKYFFDILKKLLTPDIGVNVQVDEVNVSEQEIYCGEIITSRADLME